MKKNTLRFLYLAGAMATASSAVGAMRDEVRIGNGGDALAAQFVEIGDDMVQLISTMLLNDNIKIPEGFDFESLKKHVASAKVFSATKTFLPGNIEVDALNFPSENKIIFNRDRFQRMVFNLKLERTLVIHEYMGLSGINDSSYKYSTFLTRKTLNGGDKGELWLAKDLLVPGFQNPFRTPYFEFSMQLFVLPQSQQTRYLQLGKVTTAAMLDKNNPYCTLNTGTFTNTTDAGNNKYLRIGINSVDVLNNTFGADVEFKMARAALVPQMQCFSGNSQQRLTLQNTLDALGTNVTFSHEGISPLGNVVCSPINP